MFGCLSGVSNLALTYFHQGTWWDHQDLYVARALSEDINRLPQLNRRDRVKLRLVPLLSPLSSRIPPTLRQWIRKLIL